MWASRDKEKPEVVMALLKIGSCADVKGKSIPRKMLPR
jgi:hypothetical protein